MTALDSPLDLNDINEETLDDIAEAGSVSDKLKFRTAIMVLLSLIAKLRKKVNSDEVDADDATALVNAAVSVLQPGAKQVLARQPLQLEAPTFGGAPQLGGGNASTAQQVAAQIAGMLEGKSDDEIRDTLAKFDAALRGRYDDVAELRSNLRTKEEELRKLKDIAPLWLGLTDEKRRDRLQATKDAINGILNATPADLVSKSELDAEKAKTTAAESERDDFKTKFETLNKVLDNIKKHAKLVTGGRNLYISTKELSDDDVQALGLDPAKVKNKK